MPKVGSTNCINVLFYQKYPNILNDLIAIEKIIITYAYLIILILNLRSNSSNFSILYY